MKKILGSVIAVAAIGIFAVSPAHAAGELTPTQIKALTIEYIDGLRLRSELLDSLREKADSLAKVVAIPIKAAVITQAQSAIKTVQKETVTQEQTVQYKASETTKINSIQAPAPAAKSVSAPAPRSFPSVSSIREAGAAVWFGIKDAFDALARAFY